MARDELLEPRVLAQRIEVGIDDRADHRIARPVARLPLGVAHYAPPLWKMMSGPRSQANGRIVLPRSAQPVDDVEPREFAQEAVAVALAVGSELDVANRIRARLVGEHDLLPGGAFTGREVEAVDAKRQAS